MKMLLMHTRTFSIVSTRPSNRPSRIDSFQGNIDESKKINWLIAFTCIEAHDDQFKSYRAAEIVMEHARQIQPPGIAIVPFAHLTSDLMKSSQEAYALLNDLAGCIKAKLGCEVALGDFGYHSNMKLMTNSHPLSIAYREISP